MVRVWVRVGAMVRVGVGLVSDVDIGNIFQYQHHTTPTNVLSYHAQ